MVGPQKSVTLVLLGFVLGLPAGYVARTAKLGVLPTGEIQKGGTLCLSGFEEESDLTKWQHDGVVFRRSSEGPLSGAYSARVEFLPWGTPGVTEYPQVFLERYYATGVGQQQWQYFRTLAFQARNAGKRAAQFHILVMDRTGKQFKKPIALDVGETRDIALDLAEVGREIDLSKVTHLQFYMHRPEVRSAILFDDLSLTDGGYEE